MKYIISKQNGLLVEDASHTPPRTICTAKTPEDAARIVRAGNSVEACKYFHDLLLYYAAIAGTGYQRALKSQPAYRKHYATLAAAEQKEPTT